MLKANRLHNRVQRHHSPGSRTRVSPVRFRGHHSSLWEKYNFFKEVALLCSAEHHVYLVRREGDLRWLMSESRKNSLASSPPLHASIAAIYSSASSVCISFVSLDAGRDSTVCSCKKYAPARARRRLGYQRDASERLQEGYLCSWET